MRAILLTVILLLPGCTGDLLAPSGAPAKLYTLSAPAAVQTSGPPVTWQLLVEEPHAILDLNSSRIALRPGPTRIDYYANVAWADRPPALVQELLLESFDRSGRIPAVQRQSGGLKADYSLDTDIQDFDVETGPGEADVYVAIAARLVRGSDRTIVATRIFESRTPVSGNFDGAIAAFDAGIHAILPQIVDWTLTQGSRNP